MFAGDEAALSITRIAVGVVGRAAENGEAAVLLAVFHDPVVRNVAHQHIPLLREVHWPFSPPHAGRTLFERAGVKAIFRKAWIEDLNRRIRIALVRRKRERLSKRGFTQCRGGKRRCSAFEQFTTRRFHSALRQKCPRRGKPSESGLTPTLVAGFSARPCVPWFSLSNGHPLPP